MQDPQCQACIKTPRIWALVCGEAELHVRVRSPAAVTEQHFNRSLLRPCVHSLVGLAFNFCSLGAFNTSVSGLLRCRASSKRTVVLSEASSTLRVCVAVRNQLQVVHRLPNIFKVLIPCRLHGFLCVYMEHGAPLYLKHASNPCASELIS